jgi:hypothetical protein
VRCLIKGASIEAPEVTLGDDMPLRTRLIGVSGNGLSRDKVAIALDREAELAAECGELS